MKMSNPIPLIAVVAAAGLAAGCAQVQAKAAMKDGHKLYREEKFRQAITEYEKAISHNPTLPDAHFYLASSYQALYRPGKDTPGNRENLDKAVEEYKKALELNKGDLPGMKAVKSNTLAALTGIYAVDPFKSFEDAMTYAKQLVDENPNDAKNLYAMANLYEQFEKVDEAEQAYMRVVELNPADAKACGALAAFYNKPLWDSQSRFDDAIASLIRCADLSPEDPQGYQKVATFYWDKAYRDPIIDDKQKDAYADKGLEAVDKALSLKPDYFEAIIFKGLLYRVKATVTKDNRQRLAFMDKAQELQKQGLELKKEQQEQAAAEAAAKAAAAPPQ